MTAPARLHAALHQPRPRSTTTLYTLTHADAAALNQIIADNCPTETTCEECRTRLCLDCEIGDLADCDHGYTLCHDCIGRCTDCVRDIGEDLAEDWARDGRNA